MTKSVWAIAALATALSTAAYAGDSKPVQMTDEQMDQVTAAGVPTNFRQGLTTADSARGKFLLHLENNPARP
jgi:hypothetical protein